MSFALPSLIVNEKLGTSSSAALLSGISTLVGIPMGASFGFFFKKLHDKIFPTGFGLVTIGFILVSVAIVLVLVNIGCFISPTVVNAILGAFNGTSSRQIMLISAAAFAIIFVYSVVHYINVHRQKVASE